ncbi:MAG: hypothetical protein QM730_14125 [Anaerolineales bacterium]
MKQRAGYQFLVGILLIVLVQGCVTPNSLPLSSPEPSATRRPTVTPTSLPTSTSTVTPVPWPLIHGLAYSPYRDCQSPDTPNQPKIEDIRQDLKIISSMANGIRTYSSTGINAEIPALAREMGLTVSAGAWLGKDKETNELEIQGLIDIAKKVQPQISDRWERSSFA